MTEKVFDRETLLDLTVNVIPLAILAFFFVAYLAFNPFRGGSVITVIQLAIIGLMFVGLGAVTYYSGAAVSKAEAAEETDDGDGAADASAAGEGDIADEDGPDTAADQAEDTTDIAADQAEDTTDIADDDMEDGGEDEAGTGADS